MFFLITIIYNIVCLIILIIIVIINHNNNIYKQLSVGFIGQEKFVFFYAAACLFLNTFAHEILAFIYVLNFAYVIKLYCWLLFMIENDFIAYHEDNKNDDNYNINNNSNNRFDIDINNDPKQNIAIIMKK